MFESDPEAPQTVLDVDDAAKMIGVTPSALRRWKALGEGPAYFQAGRLVRYERKAILAWIAKKTVEPSEQQVTPKPGNQ